MKKILLATHNKAKINELTTCLEPLTKQGVSVVTLKDLNISMEPEETGETIADNSLLKAKYYANIANLPVIADDGGISIDALNGEPGVKSNMWLGYKATDEELIQHTLFRLKDTSDPYRTAHMELVLTFYDPKTETILSESGRIDGKISVDRLHDDSWTPGFPFRALFIVSKYNKFYEHLSPEEHNEINHRRNAMKRLVPQIENYLLQLKK